MELSWSGDDAGDCLPSDTQFASIVVVCQNACSHEFRTVLIFRHYRDNFRLTLASVFDTLALLQ